MLVNFWGLNTDSLAIVFVPGSKESPQSFGKPSHNFGEPRPLLPYAHELYRC